MTVVRAATDTRSRNNRAAITNNPRRSGGVSGRSAEGRRIRDLLESYISSLGGYAALSDSQLNDARRAAELTALAERARAQALQQSGVVDLTALVKLEGAADRAVRRLGIAPGAHSKPAAILSDYLAAMANQKAASKPVAPVPCADTTDAPARDGSAVAGDGAHAG